jgi:hypothetical protein
LGFAFILALREKSTVLDIMSLSAQAGLADTPNSGRNNAHLGNLLTLES